jgi:regulatory protein
MQKKLLTKGYLPNVVDSALARLMENRLVDDERYAQHMVESSKGKPIGQFALRRKLKAKGVDEDAAQAALSEIDEQSQLDAAQQLARKLLPKYIDQKQYIARAKLSQALARRGFSWDVIASTIESVLSDDDWE